MRGRQLLLHYLRKLARARLALLYAVNQESQTLQLLARSGPVTPKVARTLSIDERFASILHTKGISSVVNKQNKSDSLPLEGLPAWRDGEMLFIPLRSGQEISKGLLVLCFDHFLTEKEPQDLNEGDVAVCVSLLGSYLTGDGVEKRRHPQGAPTPFRPRDGGWAHGVGGASCLSGEGLGEKHGSGVPHDADPTTTRGQARGPHPAAPHPPVPTDEIMQASMDLFELALRDGDIQRDILAYLATVLQARSGGLWFYFPAQRRFALSATLSDITSYLSMVNDSLQFLQEELLDGEMRVLNWSPYVGVLLFPLCYAGRLIGAIALAVPGREEISPELQQGVAYLSRIAALVLRLREQHSAEQQAMLDRERSRIARDLHDGVAQKIAHAMHKLEFVQRVFAQQPEAALREIGRAQQTLFESLNELRRGIASLLPPQLENQQFEQALRSLLDEFSASMPHLRIDAQLERTRQWPPSLEAPTYRFVQEALHNIRKHAQATQVSIRLQTLPGLLVAEVSDNGIGFDVEQVRQQALSTREQGRMLGLRSMQVRIEQAGGRITIASKPEQGTTISARFPLAAQDPLFTEREREVLRLLSVGATNRDIAEKLCVSVETVKSHVHHILQKMQVKDRTQAAVLATKQQWV